MPERGGREEGEVLSSTEASIFSSSVSLHISSDTVYQNKPVLLPLPFCVVDGFLFLVFLRRQIHSEQKW